MVQWLDWIFSFQSISDISDSWFVLTPVFNSLFVIPEWIREERVHKIAGSYSKVIRVVSQFFLTLSLLG